MKRNNFKTKALSFVMALIMTVSFVQLFVAPLSSSAAEPVLPSGFVKSCVCGNRCITIKGFACLYLSDTIRIRVKINLEVHDYIICPDEEWAKEDFPSGASLYYGSGGYGYTLTVPTEVRGRPEINVYYAPADYPDDAGDGKRIWHSSSTDNYFGSITEFIGGMDTFTVNQKTINMSGWIYDPDDATQSLTLKVEVIRSSIPNYTDVENTAQTFTCVADMERNDVNDVYGCGAYHGFDASFTVTKEEIDGSHYSIKVSAYKPNSETACFFYSYNNATITDNVNPPISNLDYLVGGEGTISFGGWSFDPDRLNQTVGIFVYIGGDYNEYLTPANFDNVPERVQLVHANYERKDVNAVYGCGDNHGFEGTFSVSKRGSQRVYVYADDYGYGERPVLIGSAIVYIAEPDHHIPIGNLDTVEGYDGRITITGWAFDADAYNTKLNIMYCVGGDKDDPDSEKFITYSGAGMKRPDVNEVYGCGDYHGFSESSKVKSRGEVPVYVYAQNVGESQDYVLIGQSTVVIYDDCYMDFSRVYGYDFYATIAVKSGNDWKNVASDGSTLVLSDSDETDPAQIWHFEMDLGYQNFVYTYKITNVLTGEYIRLDNNYTTLPATVYTDCSVITTPLGERDCKWFFQKQGIGYLMGLKDRDAVLNVADGENGAVINFAEKTGEGNQIFVVEKVEEMSGDVDWNGRIDLNDYAAVKAYLEDPLVMTRNEAVFADINGDGAVDAFDLFEIDRTINA